MTENRSFPFRWWPRRRHDEDEPVPGAEDMLATTELLLADTLGRSVRLADPLLEIVAHSTRVAALAGWLAAELNLEPEDRAVLRLAARLHEIGMFAVPGELLDRPAPLTQQELDRVRTQAWFGANLVRLTHGPRVARLVEHQYCDYEELCERYPEDSVDLLLASILRAADVFDAMCHPRPYQRELSEQYRTQVFRTGTGTKFHPRVSRLMLRNAG